MARPRLHTEELRDRLLGTATGMVAARGVGALSLRELAAAEGTSTTAIYSLFGNKEGLVRALFFEAFGQFHAQQLAVPMTDDPVADVAALGEAYIRWALSNPELYSVMYGGSLAGVPAGPDFQEFAIRALQPLQEAIARGIEAGVLVDVPVEVVAAGLWSGVHGISSLCLLGMIPHPATSAVTETAARAAIRAWLVEPGPGPSRAPTS